jgi:hypothetical protein
MGSHRWLGRNNFFAHYNGVITIRCCNRDPANWIWIKPQNLVNLREPLFFLSATDHSKPASHSGKLFVNWGLCLYVLFKINPPQNIVVVFSEAPAVSSILVSKPELFMNYHTPVQWFRGRFCWDYFTSAFESCGKPVKFRKGWQSLFLKLLLRGGYNWLWFRVPAVLLFSRMCFHDIEAAWIPLMRNLRKWCCSGWYYSQDSNSWQIPRQ